MAMAAVAMPAIGAAVIGGEMAMEKAVKSAMQLTSSNSNVPANVDKPFD